MTGLAQDLRYALRPVTQEPLIRGCRGNHTRPRDWYEYPRSSSLLEGVVLAPLPYFQPDRLVMVWENNPRFPRVGNSYPNFLDWQPSAPSFQQMAAFREQGIDLTFPGAPSHLKAGQISSGFFSTLGTRLALGHEFTSQENEPGGAPAVVLSNHLWRERFGKQRRSIGQDCHAGRSELFDCGGRSS